MKRGEKGFTLLEIMMVMVVLGIMFSAVVPNIRGADPRDELEQQTHQFVQLFTLASEFALLNNVELGLRIEDNTYQFLAYDGRRWVPVPDQDMLTQVSLEQPIQLALSLDDLPIDDDAMVVEQSMFRDLEDDLFEGDLEEEKPIYPQVFILSAGDITPFKLTFIYDNGFEQPLYVDVSASYTLPLTVTEATDGSR
ncbi:type II secretion system minor pseudopilin GspH [Thalassotalea maritima]|uniref:type II secretion system minor pseudopilin GspH n=1 Tax=Thalassotalea maritima TaxID=3242416 RepID=UPI003528C0A2